jgi:hypothetical protein
MGDKLPVDLDTEELFDACKDGLLICKLINLAEFDTIDTRALNVPTPAKPELSIFHKVCALQARYWECHALIA